MQDELKSRPLTAQDLGMGGSGGNKPAKPTNQSAQAKSSNQSTKSTNQNRPNNRPNNFRRGGGGGQRRRFDKKPTTYHSGTFNQNGKVSTDKKATPTGVSKIDAGKLKIIPLGGLGQIGKNIMALEYENDIIVMDLGFTFPGEDKPGIDLVIPDITYLEERKHKVRGHVITHAHEDHVGGVPFLLPKMPAPVYGAQFTIKFIERKLEEYRLDFKPEFHIVDPDQHQKIQLGVFTVEFIRITHAIPDACALAIHTPVGTIFNTGDWRFEENPVDGKPSDKKRLKEIGDKGVLLMFSDSTSCEEPGRTPTEREIVDTIDEILVRNYNRRAIVVAFSSQVTRMQIVIDAVAKAKRKLVVVGRSMLSNLELAVKLGYIKIPPGLLIKAQDMKNYQDSQLVVLSTGSQGEQYSALQRMGTGEHRDVKLKPGDIVILSSSIVPGNEKSVFNMVDNLFRWGAYVYQPATRKFDELGVMHITGHANVDEIKEMIELIRPKYYVPIHGEVHHMNHNALIAKQVGFDDKHIFVIENGQTLEATKEGVKLGPKVQVGEVLIDGAGIGDVQEIVLKDRLAMSTDGVFMVVATVDKKTGKLLTSPDIISRGFIYVKDNTELLNNARKIVKNIFAARNPKVSASSPMVKTRVRDELSNYLYKITKRNPIVLPVVIEV